MLFSDFKAALLITLSLAVFARSMYESGVVLCPFICFFYLALLIKFYLFFPFSILKTIISSRRFRSSV